MFASVIAGATFAAVLSGPRGPEDPVLGLQHRALPLPLPLGERLVLDQARLRLRPPGPPRADRRRRRRSSSSCWRGSSGGALAKLRAQLATGGAILRKPRTVLVRWRCPSSAATCARLGIIAVFLGAYGIPVTFHNVATVTRVELGLQLRLGHARRRRGHAGDEHGRALRDSTGAANATAYSVAQQLIISAWDVVFAVVLVSWVFGWSGGRELVESSYGEAKERSRDIKAERRARRRAERARSVTESAYGERAARWQPSKPRLRPLRLVVLVDRRGGRRPRGRRARARRQARGARRARCSSRRRSRSSTRCCRRWWRRCGSRSRSPSGFVLVLLVDARALALGRTTRSPRRSRRLVRQRAPRRAGDGGRLDRRSRS